MSKIKLMLFLCIFVRITVSAQVKIGDNPTTINGGSLLELETTNKGFVPPRVALTSLTATAPLPTGIITGTVVFNTASGVGSGIGLYYWNGTTWVAVSGSSGGGSGTSWLLLGNSGTNSTTNFVGNIDDRALTFKVNNTVAGYLGSQNDGQGKTSFGYSANAGDQYATAIGREAQATANTSSAFGYQAKSQGQYSVALGTASTASASSAIAIGQGSIGSAQNGIAIGNAASATSNIDNIAIGTQAAASVQQGIAIGPYSKATTNLTAMALGYTAVAAGQSSTAIGDHATASGQGGLALGVRASAAGTDAIAMGNSASAPVGNATAFGSTALASATGANAFGNFSTASGVNSVAIGNVSTSSGLNAAAFGDNSLAAGANSIAIGFTAKANKAFATVIGQLSTADGANSIILGDNSSTTGDNTILIGNGLTTAQSDALILGNAAKKIGIGTTTPGYKLTVVPQAGSDPLFLGGMQGITNYGTNDSVLTINNGVVKKFKATLLTRSLTDFWTTIGNTANNGEFLGTVDNNSLRFRTNNIQRMVLDSTGDLGIGMANPPNALSVMATDPLYLSGVQATTTLATDSVLTINAGVVRKTPYSSLQTNDWSLTGNTGTNYATNFLGTRDNVSLRMRTNNVQRMIIDSLGSVGIGSEAFGTANREKLLVDMGTTTSHTIATYLGNVNDYMQINIQNKNAGNLASADYVATANIGNDDTLYVDMGINNSNYSPSVENWGGPLDAYMYANARNLLIGTQAGTADIIFLVGGGRINANTAMRITQGSSNVVIGNRDSTISPIGNILRGPNASGAGNIPGGTLTVQGGASRGTSKGGALNLYGGGTGGSGRRGPINMLSDSLYVSGVPATTTVTSDSVLVISNTVVKKAPYSSFSGGSGGGSGWLLTGNSGTNQSTNFVGTTDFNGLNFRVNNTQAGFLGPSGSSYATSFGVNSNAVYQSTAIGAGAQATGSNASLAVGYQALAPNQNSIAIGSSASSGADESIAIGLGSNSTAYRGIAIGSAAKTSGSTQNIAIGYNSNASSFNGIAIGYNSSATTNNNTLAIGVGATASGFISMALGNGAQATAQNATAYGANSQATASGGNAFGNSAIASGTNSSVFGNNSTSSGTSSLVIGDNSLGSGAGAISIGNASTAGNSNTVVIGTNVSSSQTNAFILGNSSNNVGIGTSTPNTSTKLDVNGNFKMGTTGTVLSGIFRTTVTLDPPLIASGGTVIVTATVTGVVQNATVIVNPRSNLAGGAVIAWARASAANTIIVGFSGTGFLVDPDSAVYDVTIIQ